MKKSLSLILALTLVFGLFANMAAAADAPALTTAEKYKWFVDAGILKGSPDGDGHLADKLTRAEFATIAVAVAGLPAATSGQTFSDVTKGQWWFGAIEAAAKAGLVNGSGAGKFSPKANAAVQEIIKVAVGIAGLKPVADAKVEGASDWAGPYVQAAITAGLIAAGGNYKADATRGQTFDIAFSVAQSVAINKIAVKSYKVIDSKNIEFTLSNDEVVKVALTVALEENKETEVKIPYTAASGLKKEIVTKVTWLVDYTKVTGVSANNLVQVVVSFSNALNEDSAKTKANYTVAVGGINHLVSAADLSADKKSVTLTVAAFTNQDKYDVTIENVKDVAGRTVDKAVFSGTALDTTLPVAESVAVVGPSTLEVTFSEPLATGGTYKLNNGTYYVGGATVSGNKVTLSTSVLPEGSYTLNVTDGTDFAGFKSQPKDLTFTYAKDVTAPTVTIDSASQTKVTVKFSKKVTANAGSISVYHSYNNVANYVGASASWADQDKLTVTFASPLPVGSITVFVNSPTDANAATDAWGNKVVSTSLTATITADTTAPTVTSVNQVDSKNVDVTFSEDVSGANVASNYILKDASNNVVQILSAAKQGSTNTYRLNLALDMNGGNYSLSIPADAIKDTSYNANKLAAFATTVVISDKVRPTVVSAFYSADKKKARIVFSEGVEAAALNASNYLVSFNGAAKTTLSGATLAWGNDNKTVVISFAAAQPFSAGDFFYVAQIADLAGNKLIGFENPIAVGLDGVATANVVADSVKATAKDTIEFKLDVTLASIDVNKIQINGTNAASATYINDGGKATVTVKTLGANKFSTNLSTLNATAITVLANGFTTTFGAQNGSAVTVAKAIVKDFVAPELVGSYTSDDNNNGKIDTLYVEFSEDLYTASVQEADFTVEGYAVSGVQVSGNYVEVYVTEGAVSDTGATPKLTLVGSVSDNSTQRNSLSNQAPVTSVDEVSPYIVASTATGTGAAGTLVITFSEAMKIADLNTAVLANGIQFVSVHTLNALANADVVWSNGNKTVTITGLGTVVAGDVINSININDVAGNGVDLGVTGSDLTV